MGPLPRSNLGCPPKTCKSGYWSTVWHPVHPALDWAPSPDCARPATLRRPSADRALGAGSSTCLLCLTAHPGAKGRRSSFHSQGSRNFLKLNFVLSCGGRRSAAEHGG